MNDNAFMIRPVTITEAMLTTDAVETVAQWDADTIYLAGNPGDQVRSDTTHRIYESGIGESLGTATITIASPGVVTRTAHGLSAGDTVAFTTTGALPTGLLANTLYYVVSPTADTFEVSATSGGSAIDTSGSQSGTHTLYGNPNLGYDPTDAANAAIWLDAAPTNAWAMFDTLKSTKTEWTDSGTVELEPGEVVNSLGLAGIVGSSVQITSSDGVSDIYDVTYPLVSLDAITDWYAWFFEERVQEDILIIDDLPTIEDPTITITVTGTGEVAIGACAIGLSLDIGSTQLGATKDFKDYSTYDDDGFGNIAVVDRGYSYNVEAKLFIANTRVKHVMREVLRQRTRPVFWKLSEEQSVLQHFGFAKQFTDEITYHEYSLVSLRVEETLEAAA